MASDVTWSTANDRPDGEQISAKQADEGMIFSVILAGKGRCSCPKLNFTLSQNLFLSHCY